jgi:hypothetical protein
MTRLPNAPENWTGLHAERAIERAWKLFQQYEAQVDFESPREVQDELYRPYQLAREEAVTVAHSTNWRVKEAEMLP